jgi:hypothetical protein
MLKGCFFFFFLLSLSFLSQIERAWPLPITTLVFKEEQGVVATWRSKQHEVQHLQEDTKQGMSSTIFFAIKVFLDFQIGIRLTFIFALHVFKVRQCLDSISMSSTFKWLKFVITIVVKPTIVGTTVAKMMLLAQVLLEQCCCNEHYWSNCVGVQVHLFSRFFLTLIFLLWCRKRWRVKGCHHFLFFFTSIFYSCACRRQQ